MGLLPCLVGWLDFLVALCCCLVVGLGCMLLFDGFLCWLVGLLIAWFACCEVCYL